jgi:hypothetical protein
MAEAIHANAASGQQTRPIRKRPAWKSASRVSTLRCSIFMPVVGWMAEAIHADAASGQADEACP